MLARPAAYAHTITSLQYDDVTGETSDEVSRLVLRAISCVEWDEAVALDLIRKASVLLRPFEPAEDRRSRERSYQGGLAPWQVSRLKRFVDDHLSAPISLEELAQLVRLSTSYFSTAFKVSFGTSPHNYIVERRVAYAKHRMVTSDVPLCEIALDCGLADQAHLSRVFRRVTGTTPSAWRRQAARSEASATWAQ